MAYDRFDDLVTAKYHVVLRNWPLKTFCNPSNVASRAELELLYHAWNSRKIYFEKLTREEMQVSHRGGRCGCWIRDFNRCVGGGSVYAPCVM